MYRILSACNYTGSVKDTRTGEDRSYTKTILVVSENGGYPRIVSVDPPVFMEAMNKEKDITKKNVDFLYTSAYGKYKINKINIL